MKNNDKIQGQQAHSQNNKQQQQEEIKDDEQARKQREKDLQLNQLSHQSYQLKEERKRVMLEKAPLLEMKLVEGNGLKNKHSFKINAMGLITSQREDCDDHYVYFGSAKDMNGKIFSHLLKYDKPYML